MTNYEKIKSMDISELSEFIGQNSNCLDCMAYHICDDFPNLNCDEIIEKWLKMEVEPIHAKWLPWKEIYECSNCGLALKDNNTEYCPNCMAKMDEED